MTNCRLILVRSMRILTMFAVGLALSACVSREVVYERSLAAPHPGVSRSDFKQIAKILSQHTRGSITKIEALSYNEVMVYTAFPGEQDPGSGETFALVKDHGRWLLLDSRYTAIR